MNKHHILAILLILLPILIGCGDTDTVGTVQSEDTGVAVLVDEQGIPVSKASVKIYKYRDSTGIYVDSISTNNNGEYSFYQLELGRYTIWAETDSTIMYRDDIHIKIDDKFEDRDTLKAARTIVVPVKLQENHDPRTIEVQLWGTPIRHNVTSSGHLILNRITSGNYFARLVTTLEGYTPTNDTISITPTSPDTLVDTLELIYTGIPVVSGLRNTYDTLNSVVHLKWNQTKYKNIQAYVLERKTKTETLWPSTPLAHVYVNQASHSVSYIDSLKLNDNEITYQYRISILDNNSIQGIPFGVLEVNAPPKSMVKTSITTSSFQKAKNIEGNKASINDLITFTAEFSNPTRALIKAEWFEDSTLLQSTMLSDTDTSDGFEKKWSKIGEKNITFKITDETGKIWSKIIPISIIEDLPVITFTDTIINFNEPDTLTIHVSDEFGDIISYSWDWENDGTIDATTKQYIKTQENIIAGVECKISVMDDDSNVSEILTYVSSRLNWESVGTVSSSMGSEGFFVSLKEQIFFINTNERIWSSTNGINWKNDTQAKFPMEGECISIFNINNDMWTLIYSNDYNGTYETRDIMLAKSSDFINWDIIEEKHIKSSPSCYFSRNPMLFNNKDTLYCNIFSYPSSDTVIVNKSHEIHMYKNVDNSSWSIDSALHLIAAPNWCDIAEFKVLNNALYINVPELSSSGGQLLKYSFNGDLLNSFDYEFWGRQMSAIGGYLFLGGNIIKENENSISNYKVSDITNKTYFFKDTYFIKNSDTIFKL